MNSIGHSGAAWLFNSGRCQFRPAVTSALLLTWSTPSGQCGRAAGSREQQDLLRPAAVLMVCNLRNPISWHECCLQQSGVLSLPLRTQRCLPYSLYLQHAEQGPAQTSSCMSPPSGLQLLPSSDFGPVLKNVGVHGKSSAPRVERRNRALCYCCESSQTQTIELSEVAHIHLRVLLVIMVMNSHIFR